MDRLKFEANVKSLAREYKYCIIIYHSDLDGLTSAIAMKVYLKKYGIETIDCTKMQYGEVNIQTDLIMKTYDELYADKKIMYVMVDFAQGHSRISVHTDHHLETNVPNDDTSVFTSKAPSNAAIISNHLSDEKIFSEEDVRIINMVDSADWKENDVELFDMIQLEYRHNDCLTEKKNNNNLAICTYKLIDILKNKKATNKKFGVASIKDKKMNYVINDVIMELTDPSVRSIYDSLRAKTIGLGFDLEELEDRYVSYVHHIEDISKRFTTNFSCSRELYNTLKQPLLNVGSKLEKKGGMEYSNITTDDNIIITRDCVVPSEYLWEDTDLPKMKYNRYLPFVANIDAEYIVKLYEGLPMIQCSYNPFKDVKGVNIAEICEELIENYSSELKSYDLNLLNYNGHLNKVFEKGIYSEFKKQKDWGKSLPDKLYLTPDIITKISKFVKFDGQELDETSRKLLDRVADISLNELVITDDKKEELKSYLKRFTFNFYDYCSLHSGGHTAIYNMQLSPLSMDYIKDNAPYYREFLVTVYNITYDLYEKLKEV